MNDRERHEVRVWALDQWREELARLNARGPASDAPEDLDVFGSLKDFILNRIGVLERQLLGVPS
jgi:hypothetical protein